MEGKVTAPNHHADLSSAFVNLADGQRIEILSHRDLLLLIPVFFELMREDYENFDALFEYANTERTTNILQ